MKSIVQISVLLLAVLSVLIASSCKTEEIDQIEKHKAYTDRFKKELIGKYTLRGDGEEKEVMSVTDSVSFALKLSIDGDSEEAENLLELLSIAHPADEEILLLWGITHFEIGNYAIAMRKLTPLLVSDTPEIREEAEFTMAMAATSLDDNYSTTKKWLQKIKSTNGHKHKEVAEHLLELY